MHRSEPLVEWNLTEGEKYPYRTAPYRTTGAEEVMP